MELGYIIEKLMNVNVTFQRELAGVTLNAGRCQSWRPPLKTTRLPPTKTQCPRRMTTSVIWSLTREASEMRPQKPAPRLPPSRTDPATVPPGPPPTPPPTHGPRVAGTTQNLWPNRSHSWRRFRQRRQAVTAPWWGRKPQAREGGKAAPLPPPPKRENWARRIIMVRWGDEVVVHLFIGIIYRGFRVHEWIHAKG